MAAALKLIALLLIKPGATENGSVTIQAQRRKDNYLKLPSMIKGWLNPAVSPEQLLSQYGLTGKAKPLEQLVALFNGPIFHYLLSQSNKEIAEDIIQSTWLKVIKRQSAGNILSGRQQNVKSWLFTIARNTLIDELRRQNKWQASQISEQELAGEPLERIIDSSEQLAKFNQALAQLSFHQREVFIFKQEGFSMLEICQLTDESFETIKSRLRYARQNIKKLLGTSS